MVTIGPNETKFSEIWIKIPTFCSNENVVYRMSTFFLYRASALMMKNNFEWIGSTCFSTWPSPAAILLQCIFYQTALITCGTGRIPGSLATVTCHQQPRPKTCRRLLRVPRHEKLWNYVTWPAWENSNVFLFNWCLYSSEISDCKSP